MKMMDGLATSSVTMESAGRVSAGWRGWAAGGAVVSSVQAKVKGGGQGCTTLLPLGRCSRHDGSPAAGHSLPTTAASLA